MCIFWNFLIFIYSTIQYFQIKEKAYIFYSLTLLVILILEVIIDGFVELNKAFLPLAKVVIFSSAFLFLNLFNLHFYNKNNLKSKLSFLTLFLIFVLFYTFLNIVIDTDNFWLKIFFLFLLIILYFYIINKNIFKYYSPPLAYFIALIGYILGALISYLMYENLLPTNFFFKNAYVFGGIWLMIFLAITLNDIIKKIILEKNEITLKSKIQEKILFFQSKQLSLGELVGNIAHQWREPLAEVGAIQTNMKASLILESNLNKNKLLDLLEQNNSIIQYLSSTIDVFYRILKNEDSINSKFNLKKEIENIEKLVFYIFKTKNIRFDYEIDENIFILGDKNEFINALLNIVLNAKDILVVKHMM
ncbi:7TM diverse intracellular signaling domain-containing protein [Aliarcobacter butzleri]|uniref:7TM diverse intracellular signaling domain-containing protein n=1 Tax=Aliarcobacter butzleri TaxID=28197 RepID=UPI003AFA879A